MESKGLVTSKTAWVATAAPVVSWLLGMAGLVVPAEVQIAVLGIVNIVLRFVTKQPVDGLI